MSNRNNTYYIEQNFFALCRYWGRIMRALLQRQSVGAMSIGLDEADVNWAWNEKPLNKKSVEILDEIKCFYRKLKKPFWWWVYPCGQAITTKHVLQDAGFKQIQKMSCMALASTKPANLFSSSKYIKVRNVTNEKERLLWEKTCFAGFEMSQRTKKQFHSFVSNFDLSEKSPQKLFLAYDDNIPVTTSLLFINQNTAGIYYVSTIASHRRRGYCSALIQETLREALALGISNIVLQATPQGVSVYQKAGFIEIAKADIYVI